MSSKVLNEMDTKTIMVIKRRKLADGTVKEYRVAQTYKLNGYVRKDGTRALKTNLSDEQINEVRRLRATGVPKSRLITDFGCSRPYLNKILA